MRTKAQKAASHQWLLIRKEVMRERFRPAQGPNWKKEGMYRIGTANGVLHQWFSTERHLEDVLARWRKEGQTINSISFMF